MIEWRTEGKVAEMGQDDIRFLQRRGKERNSKLEGKEEMINSTQVRLHLIHNQNSVDPDLVRETKI